MTARDCADGPVRKSRRVPAAAGPIGQGAGDAGGGEVDGGRPWEGDRPDRIPGWVVFACAARPDAGPEPFAVSQSRSQEGDPCQKVRAWRSDEANDQQQRSVHRLDSLVIQTAERLTDFGSRQR